MDKPFRRILLIKMRFHGDMLLTTPVISSLKKNYPDAKIDVLLYQDTIPILSENPEINALYGIKNKKAKASEKKMCIRDSSKADKLITERIIKSCQFMDLRVLDHIVIGRGKYVSFAERGWI